MSVTGVGDQLDRKVSITENGNNTNLIVRDDGFGGLIISGGSINGQSMTYGELERAKRDLNNAGYDVVLSESAGQRPSKTPNTGEPGSKYKNPGSGQERIYGPDGKPLKDIDYDHDHGQGIPHVHDWDTDEKGNPVRNPGRPLDPERDR